MVGRIRHLASTSLLDGCSFESLLVLCYPQDDSGKVNSTLGGVLRTAQFVKDFNLSAAPPSSANTRWKSIFQIKMPPFPPKRLSATPRSFEIRRGTISFGMISLTFLIHISLSSGYTGPFLCHYPKAHLGRVRKTVSKASLIPK